MAETIMDVVRARDEMKRWWKKHIGEELPKAYPFILLVPLDDAFRDLIRFVNQTNTFPIADSLIFFLNHDDPFSRSSFLREYEDGLVCNAENFLVEVECIRRYYRNGATRLFLDLTSNEVDIVAAEMLDP
jgi:hypothetical protein